MSGFKSIFAKHLESYVKLNRGLGLSFENQEDRLLAFDRFVCERNHQTLLSQELALAFATSDARASGNTIHRRYLVVRRFSEYLSAFEPRTPALDLNAVRRHWQQPPPYILTENEQAQLLARAANYSPRFPALSRAIHAMLGLAMSTGLRLREVLSLDIKDVNFESNLLIIRDSKFHKDRLVAMHPTTTDVLRAYAAHRLVTCSAFFVTTKAQRFKARNVEYIFRQLVSKLALQSPTSKPPTFRSLRHTFAVNRLAGWYRAGQDVQAMLPALATFMGHVHYTSTAYYLNATAELLDLAAERLATAPKEVSCGQK